MRTHLKLDAYALSEETMRSVWVARGPPATQRVVEVDVVDDRPQPERHEPVGALAAAAAGRPTEHEPERAALSVRERETTMG